MFYAYSTIPSDDADLVNSPMNAKTYCNAI